MPANPLEHCFDHGMPSGGASPGGKQAQAGAAAEKGTTVLTESRPVKGHSA